MAGESLITGALGAAGVPVFGNVWTHENPVESDNNTKTVPLPDLFEGAQDPKSQFVHVTGTTPTLGGVFKYEPFQQSLDVTVDGFDQVAAYIFLSGVYHDLEALGFDMPGIIGSKHSNASHAIRAFVNFMKDVNAYYSPSEDILAFGTAGDKWHLASDGDVVVHEGGHFLLYHINPGLGLLHELFPADIDRHLILDHVNHGLGGWGRHEGGAIHEAFGDILAALYWDDPHMSEVFPVFDGNPPDKNAGLRIVDNDLTLRDVGEEVHDRGRVYDGFAWSLYQTFIQKGGPEREVARALAKRLLMNHASHYATSRPDTNDFVDAMIGGAKALGREKKLPIPLGALTEMIEMEATRRLLRTPTLPKPDRKRPPYKDVQSAIAYYGRISNHATQFQPYSSAPYIGGTFKTHRQYYPTQNYGLVEVVGHGMQARIGAKGQTLAILDRDVRLLHPQEIDESTLIPFDEALKRVSDVVQQELIKGKRKLRMIEMRFQKTLATRHQVYEWKEVSGHVLAFQLCRQSFTQAPPQQPKYVVLDNDKELSYEIDLGYATFYVNARTGVVQFAKKIFF